MLSDRSEHLWYYRNGFRLFYGLFLWLLCSIGHFSNANTKFVSTIFWLQKTITFICTLHEFTRLEKNIHITMYSFQKWKEHRPPKITIIRLTSSSSSNSLNVRTGIDELFVLLMIIYLKSTRYSLRVKSLVSKDPVVLCQWESKLTAKKHYKVYVYRVIP